MPIPDTDPAAVVFDAAAQSRKQNYSSRHSRAAPEQEKRWTNSAKFVGLWTKKPLMPKLNLLVLDATLGQNGLRQAEIFTQAAQLSGVVLTKMAPLKVALLLLL